MNYRETLENMLSAAAGAAKGHWGALRDYAEIEFKQLSQTALGLEADYVSDMVVAETETDPAQRAEMERRAKRRTELAFDSLKLAAEGVVIAAEADARIAAQDAVNAALGVLRSAINTSVGVALL